MNSCNNFRKETGCPKLDCKQKTIDFRKVVIPASMGSDEEGQPYAPENGAYNNAIVYYEASGVSYIYSSDGIYTKIANIQGGLGEVISVNGKKGVVTITIGELNGLTADQIVTRINSAKAEDKAYTDTKTAAAKSEAIASAKTYTDTKTAQVEAEIPTKTSDLTNDSGFQNATQVNAAIAPVSAKADATDAAINKSVVNSVGITASSSTDTLNLTDGKINIKTGTTTSETIPFPVASATSAGVMNSATYQGLVDVTDIANGLLEGAVAVTGLSDEPTQTQISNAWKTATGRTTLMNRAVVYDVTNQKLWTYYTNTSTWYPVTAGGSVDVQPWTNTQAGIVKGSTQDGQIFAENDGTGSVNGWDEVKTDIANLENAGYQTESQVDAKIATAKTELEAEIDEKQDELTAGENITIEDNVISAVIPEKPYISLERNSEYLYTVTFDALPEETPADGSQFGACSAFVRDGKLYRNLDWYYNNNASFRIITKDFEGMSFANGLTDGNLDDEKIAQLPYQVTDGVNRYGIMVSTHVLYNDWGATGTGTIPLTKLPFIVLTQVKSMDTLETDLGDTLSNMYVPQAMAEAEYLIQVLVTDGTTTYVLKPGNQPNQTYEAVDATNNPKLTNFLWVDRATVERNGSYMQNRPTGVERWNEIDSDTTLEDLRFTKAYESPTRLSEFIGIDETTKSSTDAELEAIYDEAHAEYLIRQRDGKTWQTMHSVVYGPNGIERLYVQEDWDKDYSYATREYVDEAVEAVEGEIPELLGSTGQSEVAGMTQKAITDALAGAGGELAHKLTTADYNYPASNPNSVALWLLEPGVYWKDTNDGLDIVWNNGTRFEVNPQFYTTYVVGGKYTTSRTIVALSSGGSSIKRAGWIWNANASSGNVSNYQRILSDYNIEDVLTSTSTTNALSANQGKVLKDMIGNLTDLDTTDQSNLVAAINEVAEGGSGPTVVQTTGTSTTDVMSQDATTKMVFADGNLNNIRVGGASNVTAGFRSTQIGANGRATGTSSNAVGYQVNVYGSNSVGVGNDSNIYGDGMVSIGGDINILGSGKNGSIALGRYSGSNITAPGIMDVGSSQISYGYNSTNYRLLTGLHDPVSDHDAATKKYVDDHSGGGGVNVVQAIGDSTTDVMSQKAVTDELFSKKVGDNTYYAIQITGGPRSESLGRANAASPYDIAIGNHRTTTGSSGTSYSLLGNIAVGAEARTSINYMSGQWRYGMIALGAYSGSNINASGMMDISSSNTNYGYNNTNYRLLTGVHDGINAHDAATVNQLNALIDSINAAMNTSIPHIGNS